MTVNPKTFELRNLIATERPEGVKCCGVCGKPESSLTKQAKELPLHKQAIDEDWAGRFRQLTHALGGKEKLMDFTTRKEFNAQLEQYRKQLTEAREEHDEMPVLDKAKAKANLQDTLGKTLGLLGIKLADDAKAQDMAQRLYEEVGCILAVRADEMAAEENVG